MDTGIAKGNRDVTTEADTELARARRAITSALETVAAPHVAEAILRVALARARLESVPTDGAALADFVSGPLYQRMTSVVGDEHARGVLDELTRFVRARTSDGHVATSAEVPSGLRRRPQDHASGTTVGERVRASITTTVDTEAETARPPRRARDANTNVTRRPLVGDPLFVIVGSLDSRRHLELARCLGPDAAVLQAEDVMELVEAVQAAASQSPVVVLDGASPSVHPSTFAAMMPDLASGVRVVLWGFDGDRERAALASVMPVAESFMHVPLEVKARDLALLLGMANLA